MVSLERVIVTKVICAGLLFLKTWSLVATELPIEICVTTLGADISKVISILTTFLKNVSNIYVMVTLMRVVVTNISCTRLLLLVTTKLPFNGTTS